MPPVLSVSLSAVQAYRDCEQLYYYKYIERLRRKDKAAAPQLGIMLHDYLALYYQALKDGTKPGASHSKALSVIDLKYAPECKRMAKAAHNVGQDKIAKEILTLPEIAKRIAARYHWARGRADAEAYEILLVEEFVSIPLFKGRAVSNGRIDLVTKERSSGLIDIWEHKSTKNVPSTNYRLRDLQTPLYAHKLSEMGLAPEIDRVLWNYIRTKEPAKPKLLKSGKLTIKKSLDSTYEIYIAALDEIGADRNDPYYLNSLTRLEGREHTIFFKRYPQPILSDFDLLFRDYRRSVREIARSRKLWHSGVEPVRNLGQRCDFCEMATLCNAAILGGDDSDVKMLRFTVGS